MASIGNIVNKKFKMKPKKFSISKISRQLKNAWTPINVAKVDNFILNVAKFEGSYHWHQHENNDDLFIVFKGKIKINRLIIGYIFWKRLILTVK